MSRHLVLRESHCKLAINKPQLSLVSVIVRGYDMTVYVAALAWCWTSWAFALKAD
jgi:hypothetical protein